MDLQGLRSQIIPWETSEQSDGLTVKLALWALAMMASGENFIDYYYPPLDSWRNMKGSEGMLIHNSTGITKRKKDMDPTDKLMDWHVSTCGDDTAQPLQPAGSSSQEGVPEACEDELTSALALRGTGREAESSVSAAGGSVSSVMTRSMTQKGKSKEEPKVKPKDKSKDESKAKPKDKSKNPSKESSSKGKEPESRKKDRS
jgi:hypothetical protein